MDVRIETHDDILAALAESSVFSGIFDSRLFEVSLENALKVFSKEIQLQDILSTINQIFSKQVNPQGKLSVFVQIGKINNKEEYIEYAENNISGDYILTYNGYVQVYTGIRYKLQYANGKTTYVLDREGIT
ncbi:MAG: hypothetical protein ACP5PP_03530 [Fervidobacterium sp.]